jgi:hypothetical protein
MYSQLVPAAWVDGADDPSGLHASVAKINSNAHRRRAFTAWIVRKGGRDSVSFP